MFLYRHPKTKKKLNKKKIKYFNGIPDLFFNDNFDITKAQSIFYDKIKFPNYDKAENFGDLLSKLSRSDYIKKLDQEIPYFSKVLEAGCGTGQLSIILSRYGRKVFGIDLSKGSLIMGQKFIKNNNIKNVFLSRMNIFHLCFSESYFDVVISNGVLHHTKKPELAFSKLTQVLKPGGYVAIGLYHKYGRLMHNIKQILAKGLGEKIMFLDSRLSDNISKRKKYAWFNDQYCNPHESTHTYREVLQWFKNYDIEYLNSIPFDFNVEKKIFNKNPVTNKLKIFFKEILLSVSKNQIRENGFFVMLGKKKI